MRLSHIWLVPNLIVIVLVLNEYRCEVLAQQPNPTAGNKAIDFSREIYPVLQRACIECHGVDKQEGGLRLDLRDEVFSSGIIEAGDPDESELLRRISLPRTDDEVMPAIGDPLSRRHVAALRTWIKQGAPWPEDFTAGKHWSYVAPRMPVPPQVANPHWIKSPIDRFVVRRLSKEGMMPSPRASTEKLVRRVYLDLIGLPPTPAEVNAFLADDSENRYEQLVDKLLARPQFGERWARPWLDLARYADSHGFQKDDLREHWAYRDWVIRALNDDMPFDQFTIEQIAGDLIPNATEAHRIATGFHRCTPSNVEAGSLPEETRIEQVIDRVNTTGAVWLGTTLECCQCHDHKYDPFSQKDYYKLLAFYNNTEQEADRTSPKEPSSIQFNGPSMDLSDPQRDALQADLQQQLNVANRRNDNFRKKLEVDLENWVTDLVPTSGKAPQTHVLDITHFESEGVTDSFEKLEDGSVLLVGGDPPDTDVYTVHAAADLSGIRKFRLDVLQHESLPGEGPGRGDPKRRNFVLNEFSAELRLLEPANAQLAEPGPGKGLVFSSAKASFSQKNWDVSGALKTSHKFGWAISPQFDRAHWAEFTLADPLDLPKNSELVFKLVQKWGNSRSIGRFRISAFTGSGDGLSIPGDVLKLAKKDPATWTKRERVKLIDFRAKRSEHHSRWVREISELKKRSKKNAPETTLVMIELEKPRISNVFQRGNYQSPGEEVEPGTPEVLHTLPEGPKNRLTLAHWLVSPENPLVARVAVNRLWAELFGQGIVTTVEDFGIKGEPPTHPDLLDWLAVRFVEDGWSVKKLLRAIVLSATYQQSSHVSDELLEMDDRNRMLARGPRLRMDAEMIRDNALSIAGLLDLTQYGQPIRPYQPDGIWIKTGGKSYQYGVSPGSQKHRRGVYVILKRGSPYPSFVNFDATARLACTVKRSRTNTPLQALTLLNDPVYVEAADSLAKRVLSEKNDELLDAKLDFAFQLCTARIPTKQERETLQDLYVGQLNARRDTAGANNNDAELAAWQSVATVLLNLHETITKD